MHESQLGMEITELLQSFFDTKMLSIIKLFLKEDGKQYYLREISKLTKVSPASTYRILKKLVDLQVITLTEIKTAKLYSLNTGKTVELLRSFLEIDVIQSFVEKASAVEGVDELYLYGKKEKSKATIFILGPNIEKNQIKQIINDFKERHNFSILDNYFTKEQYDQIQGLFAETKKLLYKKA